MVSRITGQGSALAIPRRAPELHEPISLVSSLAKIPRGCCPVGRLVRAGPADIRPEAEHTGLSTVQVYRGSMGSSRESVALVPAEKF